MGALPLPLANGPFLAALQRALPQPGGNILTQKGGIWASSAATETIQPVEGAAVGHLLTSLG